MYSPLVGGPIGLPIYYITPMLLDMLGPNYRPNYERASWSGKKPDFFSPTGGKEYRLTVGGQCVAEMG